METPGSVKFLGIHFKDEKQRKIVLIASFVGILAFLFYMADRKSKASAGTNGTGSMGLGIDPGAGNNGPINMPGFPGGSGSDNPFQVLSDQITQLGDAITGGTSLTPKSSIKFDYTQDMTSQFEAQGKYSKSSSGGSNFSLGGGGFSLGFGSSSGSSTQREASFAQTNRDIFSNQSELVGVSDSVISQFLDFSKTIGGTYGQKIAHQDAVQAANNAQANRFIGTNVVGGVEVKEKKSQTINNVTQSMSATNSAKL